MKLQTFLLLAILTLSLAMAVSLKAIADASQPEIRTVYETITETITKTEYIKINSTEPMEMITTAYTSGPESTGKRPGDKGYGITYTGTMAKYGVCAVDPDFIPLGTSLFVEDYGYCHAEDIGGSVKGPHVDVWMEHVSDSLKFGKERRKVWILKNFD